MSRILIADCWHAAVQAELIEIGVRPNVTLFEDTLRLHDSEVVCTSINIADRHSLPPGTAIADFDGVILTGSPLHIGDPTPTVRYQIEFTRAAFATDVAVWGSCWGLQLAAVALGGSVRRNPNGREIGVARAITVTADGRSHPLLAGRPAVFDALCAHADEIDALPPGATVLAANSVSAIQAMAAPTPAGGQFYGTQYHPELDLIAVAALFQLRAAALAAEGFGQTEAELHALADDYRALSARPQRQDLAWRYGIGPDILDPVRRSAEFGNWLRSAVHPRRMR